MMAAGMPADILKTNGGISWTTKRNKGQTNVQTIINITKTSINFICLMFLDNEQNIFYFISSHKYLVIEALTARTKDRVLSLIKKMSWICVQGSSSLKA